MTLRPSLALGLLLCGCTIVPKPVASTAADVSGNDAKLPVPLTDGGWLINSGDKARYDALVGRYGKRFLVPLRKGDGLIPAGDHWVIDQEHMIDFGRMAEWFREEGTKP